MAKALLLTPFEAKGLLSVEDTGFGTLIVGSEFCQNQLPGAGLLAAVKKRFPAAAVWLASSLLTDKGLAGWEKLLASVPRGLISGVIFNDWGLLPALAARKLPASAGRLIMREFLRIDKSWAGPFMKRHRAAAAETDTPELEKAAAALGLNISSHRRNVFTAVTTFCPFERHFSHECGHACEGRLDELQNKHLPAPLFLAEKAYFTAAPARRRAAPWREVVTLNFLPGRRG